MNSTVRNNSRRVGLNVQPRFLSRCDEKCSAQQWFEIDVFFEGIREPIEQCFPLPAVMRLLLGERRQSFGRSELVEPASPPGTVLKHSMQLGACHQASILSEVFGPAQSFPIA